MEPAKRRGLTTQNAVLWVRSGSACRVVSIVTTTWEWSGARSRLLTVPKTMSLNLSCDWPACRPSAESKVTVIVGPCLRQGVPGEPRADRDRDERDQPDHRHMPRAPGRGMREHRRLGEIGHCWLPATRRDSVLLSSGCRNFVLLAARVNPSARDIGRARRDDVGRAKRQDDFRTGKWPRRSAPSCGR